MEKEMIVEIWQDENHCRTVCRVPQDGDDKDQFSEYGKSIAAIKKKALIKVFQGNDWEDCMEQYHRWLEGHHCLWEHCWEYPRYRA